ncbi:glucan 1,3-beta-glucosidase GLUC78 precursor [Ophiocordyceps sinensis CO18]|uniref:Glucan 1,3-beta-glucosidase GLUC78 n=1 Tax=Ophiocordyceps sinensis (strain Co18 / CGMCC 3.14243) TaxID=911162 RepID=T5ACQ1_OPHSC|nr:glucan 1,3-beta-glucosidase GLUC78 precursor [Ophiocordyceps sinensis CO18]
MDNGSGGFMTDLVFNGGRYGAFFGNQQFTTRNLTFNDCNTAIYMNWNWVWTFHGLSINNCGMGIDMTQGGAVQTVGSILVLDSTFSNTPVGVATVYNPAQTGTNGTLVLDNVDMSSNVPVAVQRGQDKKTLLPGNTRVASWAQGRSYQGASGKAGQGSRQPVRKPAALVDRSGRVVTKSKPQYNNVPASRFVSVKSKGAKGDGKTDDTNAIRRIFNEARPNDIIYFDHGAYIITDTVQVPKDIKVVGEIWPLIMAAGDRFKDQNNPKPVFQVGQPGDVGNVEMQDLMFETQGPQPGAILMEFNVAGKTQASAGLFDVHFRVGGSAGTQLQMDKCVKNPAARTEPNPECIGAFMLLHITSSASPYLENVWMWVADHELDIAPYTQIDIFNGRGVLIESTKGAWLWGTSSEHNVLSNYQLNKAQNVFMALIQSETAYFQPNPDATKPFKSNPKYADPDFSRCRGETCARTWGMRINDSKDVLVYGGGLYSFFNNYDQVCVGNNDCQDNMIAIDNSRVELFGISTKASVAMVTLNGQSAAKDLDNRNNFCAAIAAFETS